LDVQLHEIIVCSRRNPHTTILRRQRAALWAPGPKTNRHYNLPEIGKKIASKAHREGVSDRFAAPAVPKSSEVDLALITSYDPLQGDVELSIGKAATHPDAPPRALGQPVPGLGKMLSRVLLDAMHDSDRLAIVQDCGASGRLGTWAKASAGKRVGPSGKKIGNAPLQGACSEAAVLC
jgi:hypothetical protein